MDTKKVLVADDEADLREALATALRSSGLEVITVADGAEAIAVATVEKPDLLVLDLQMPKVDGVAALTQIRTDAGWGVNVPVMMLTAQSDISKISDAVIPGGVNFEYLVKTDWKLTEIVEKIKTKLEIA